MGSQHRRLRTAVATAVLVASANAFSNKQYSATTSSTTTSCLNLVPPPGSGYAGPEYEIDELPSSYEPMMEYPGTMRPGRTPENMPFHDLPIGDDDPDPVPWPHFQQIEWHHRWAPPHPHPVPMEDFIEQHGRWATPEMEAKMRAGTRQNARTRKEMEEAEKRDTLIMDDDEDDEDDMAEELPQELGEGIFGSLGSTDDAKIIADAVSPDRMNQDTSKSADEDDEDDDDDVDAGLDDFLLDLGLDSLGDEDDDDDDDDNQPRASSGTLEDVVMTEDGDEDEDDEESVNPDVTASIDVDDDDDDLELGLEDDDTLDDSMEVPLEEFGEDENELGGENFFDDGGFDFDDGGDFDGGDFDGGFD